MDQNSFTDLMNNVVNSLTFKKNDRLYNNIINLCKNNNKCKNLGMTNSFNIIETKSGFSNSPFYSLVFNVDGYKAKIIHAITITKNDNHQYFNINNKNDTNYEKI